MRTNRILALQMVFILIGPRALLLARDQKPVANVNGTWKWTYKTKDGKDAQAALKLKQDGDKITGAYVARDGVETPIEEGKITGNDLAFNVNRDVSGQKMLFQYSGKLDGDTITGKIVFGHPKPTPHEWEAKRSK